MSHPETRNDTTCRYEMNPRRHETRSVIQASAPMLLFVARDASWHEVREGGLRERAKCILRPTEASSQSSRESSPPSSHSASPRNPMRPRLNRYGRCHRPSRAPPRASSEPPRNSQTPESNPSRLRFPPEKAPPHVKFGGWESSSGASREPSTSGTRDRTGKISQLRSPRSHRQAPSSLPRARASDNLLRARDASSASHSPRTRPDRIRAR